MFRTLRANEIEARVAQVKEKGLTLLLYKDARCDMNILDETIGPMNWKREHTRENANCIVSLWDKEKGQWIGKEDTGTESFTEKEKGLASDSFKRACFNWGIGRELYTAPFIWITSSKAEIKSTGANKFTCYDKFTVVEIGYDENRCINKLVIANEKTYEVVFSTEIKPTVPKKTTSKNVEVTEPMEKRLYEIGKKANITPGDIIKVIKSQYNKVVIKDLTKEEYETIYKRIESKVK